MASCSFVYKTDQLDFYGPMREQVFFISGIQETFTTNLSDVIKNQGVFWFVLANWRGGSSPHLFAGFRPDAGWQCSVALKLSLAGRSLCARSLRL